MSEHVPPGGTPVAPAPGWYPDPGSPGQARFWDGYGWTDQTAPPPRPVTPAPPPVGGVHYHAQGSGFGPVFYIGVVFFVLATILVVTVLLVRHGASAGSGGESAAVGACRYFVEARLQSPGSADFSRIDAIAPVSGEQWTVTGSVESETPTGQPRRTDFTCRVEPVSGGWHLVALRFPRR